MSEQRYWGRYYKLTIIPPSGGKKVFMTNPNKPAMDIKFDVTYARGQTAREGTVSILGLGYETIHEIISLAGINRGAALSKRARLILEAGYNSSAGKLEIINGFMWYGSVSSPPTMWVTIKVAEYDPLGDGLVAIHVPKDMSVKVAMESILKQFSRGTQGKDADAITYVLKDLTQDKLLEKGEEKVKAEIKEEISLHDCIQKLSKELSHEVQFVLRTRTEDNTGGQRTVEVYDKNVAKAAIGDIYVDGDHGLLSVTGIDAVSGCVTTFIDASVGDDVLSHMVLTSDLNPQANGRYYIYKKQYVGHFLGNEWYVRYFCSGKEGEVGGDTEEGDDPDKSGQM